MTVPRMPRTLAIHPVSRGFGWVVFESPLAPIDWGFAVTRRQKNEVCVEKVEGLMIKYLPETLVLEAYEFPHAHRSERMTRLGRALHTLATARGVDVVVFTRVDIKACFRSYGAKSRHEIAQVIVRHIAALEGVLPQKRKRWETERDRLAIFSAAAVGLTSYYLNSQTLFADLKGQSLGEGTQGMKSLF